MRTIVSSILLAVAVLGAAGPARAFDLEKMYDPRTAFAQTDHNGDGRVDLKEFVDRIDDVFYAADLDKNGFLDRAELARLPFAGDYARVDRNGDGRVSMHEFEVDRVHLFELVDTDRDGELSLEEVVAAYEKNGERR